MNNARFLAPLFFLSGFPALLYQVVWQRSLFALFGSNIESVTVVVAAFMLGLGLGSLAGGRISSRFPTHLLRIFALMELSIGLLGVVSIGCIHAVGAWTAGAELPTTSIAAIGLVVLPTTLMGATLPVLTAYLVQHLPNVGRSVGMLYFVNTLGSATACFAAGYVLMGWLGQQGVVWLAAGMNLFVGSIAFWYSTRQAAKPLAAIDLRDAANDSCATAPSKQGLTLGMAALLAALVGFISLSLEITWVRTFSFATAGRAPIFSYVIGYFLLGIALGSWGAERLTNQHASTHAEGQKVLSRWMVGLTVFAALIGFMIIPIMGRLAVVANYRYAFSFVALGAASWGAMLPLLAHLTVPADSDSGRGLSLLYAANIAGAVCGSLLTGFVFMEYLNTATLAKVLLLLGLSIAWLIHVATAQQHVRIALILCVLGLVAVATTPPLYQYIHEQLLYGASYSAANHFAVNLETRNGVVSITASGTVYGSGAYDGKVNTHFASDNNGIHRAFALSAYHAKPRKILMIGLASGSWVQVVADHPDVESLHVVEINPGYLRAIARYPDVAGVLKHPKIKIDIDDGRRWLLARKRAAQGAPLEQYDLIVMNTTWHWRAYASAILSADFLQIAKQFLAPGGLIYYNATYSPEVHRTAASVFPHSIRYSNMVLAGMSPIVADVARWEQTMLRYKVNGASVLNLNLAVDREALTMGRTRFYAIDPPEGQEWEWNSVESREHLMRRTDGARIITDDNMGTEWMPNS